MRLTSVYVHSSAAGRYTIDFAMARGARAESVEGFLIRTLQTLKIGRGQRVR